MEFERASRRGEDEQANQGPLHLERRSEQQWFRELRGLSIEWLSDPACTFSTQEACRRNPKGKSCREQKPGIAQWEACPPRAGLSSSSPSSRPPSLHIQVSRLDPLAFQRTLVDSLCARRASQNQKVSDEGASWLTSPLRQKFRALRRSAGTLPLQHATTLLQTKSPARINLRRRENVSSGSW